MRRNQIAANSKPEKTTKLWEWTQVYDQVKESGLAKCPQQHLYTIHRSLTAYLAGTTTTLNSTTRVKFKELLKLLEAEMVRRSPL